jgi:hypothetical protein
MVAMMSTAVAITLLDPSTTHIWSTLKAQRYSLITMGCSQIKIGKQFK